MKRTLAKSRCRICNSRDISHILDLGRTPLANALLRKQDLKRATPRFPLELMFCSNCTLVQLRHTVDPKALFSGTYRYASGASQPLVEHFRAYAEDILDGHIEGSDDLVVEIGSNDGSLLSFLKDDVRVLGVDPAQNMAKEAKKKGVPTVVDFFTEKTAKRIKKKYGSARVIVANNVFAHIDDIYTVLRGVAELLEEDGAFIFEVNWGVNMIEEGSFDQIYHEHLFYYSLHSLEALAERSGFILRDAALYPIHGKTLRVTFTRSGKPTASVASILKKEKSLGMHTKARYARFASEAKRNGRELTTLLKALKKSGALIAAYGAPAKGNTLLNVLGINDSVIEYVVDSTPFKQGLYMPGSNIPIVHPDTLSKDTPDYVVLLAWNYADAILKKERLLRKKGVKFIVPVPTLKIV